MPPKKQPQPLECQSLLCVPKLVRKVVKTVAEKLSDADSKQRAASSAAAAEELDEIISIFRNQLFTFTAHYFHKDISMLIMAAISDHIGDEALRVGNREEFLLNLSQSERRKFKKKEQIILQFSSLLCDPSVHTISLPIDMDLNLVKALCSVIPRMTWLKCLDLGSWQCYKHGLLSSINTEHGSGLMYLENLVMLSVTDAPLDFIINISVYCPNLQSLTLSKSEVIYYKSYSRNQV